MSDRLTKRQRAYLSFLASDQRPRSFDGLTGTIIVPLSQAGLIVSDPRTDSRPLLMRWWMISDAGRKALETKRDV